MSRPRPEIEAAFIILIVVVVGISVIWQGRRAALEDARATASNLAALLHEQTSTAFKTADLALFAAYSRLETTDPPQDDAGFRAYLKALVSRLDHVRALYVIGADGFIIHDTDYPETPRVSLADRSYFRALANKQAEGIFIGSPVLSRSVGRWFVPVARRIEQPDGSFSGIIAAAVESSFFEQAYGQLQLKQRDSITLFHADSTLIARVPPMPDLFGRQLPELRLFSGNLPETQSGVYRVPGAFTGREAIIGYARLSEVPLIVTVVIDRHDSLAGWRRQAWVVAMACLSILAIGWLLYVSRAKRRLERQIDSHREVMREKLESIGYMTSGLAHDFRNLLAAVYAGIQLIRKRGPEEKLLTGIEDAVERGNRLTANLLQFARDENFDKLIFSPNARIENLDSLLKQVIAHDVELSLDLAGDAASVAASPAFFDASLMNLVVNSSHAMPEGGELCISTRNFSVEGDAVLSPGPYVAIRVVDTGHGIPPDKLDSVFDPFVTSKGRQGTGLGLFQVRRFASEAGGTVRIRSKVGSGTTVEILLPVASAGTTPPMQMPQASNASGPQVPAVSSES